VKHKHELNYKHFGGKYSGYSSWYCKLCKKKFSYINVSNCEVSLHSHQFCNLVEINASNIQSQEDLNQRAKVASFIATLQASYTNFHYLREEWKKTTEKEALIGVGMTGICSGIVQKYDLKEAAKVVIDENERIASLIKINEAARTLVIKPSGTSSLVLGTSSGIHPWHSPFYIRRIRVGKNEAIYNYLNRNHPELVEDDFFRPQIQAVISIPQKAPEGSIYRNESAIDFMERIKFFYENWILVGHRSGSNTNNISATVSIKKDEWDKVADWLWENKECFNGLSFLPYDEDDHTYVQSPFEEIDEKTYKRLYSSLRNVDLSRIREEEDDTDLKGEIACSGKESCEVK